MPEALLNFNLNSNIRMRFNENEQKYREKINLKFTIEDVKKTNFS